MADNAIGLIETKGYVAALAAGTPWSRRPT